MAGSGAAASSSGSKGPGWAGEVSVVSVSSLRPAAVTAAAGAPVPTAGRVLVWESTAVAVPIGWDALADVEGAGAWSIKDVDELIARAVDTDLKGWGFAAQALPTY